MCPTAGWVASGAAAEAPDEDASRPPPVAGGLFGAGLAAAVQYAELLATMGVRRGVIGPREAGRIWSRHLLNSVAVVTALPQAGVVVDIGSGAGLPGVAIAIARPDLRIHLVEPLQRRVTWLQEVVDQLDLKTRVSIHHGRAEDLNPVPADVVVSRAVAPLGRLLPWCVRWCRPGGLVVAVKGERAAEELDGAVIDLVAWGLSEPSVARFGEGVLTPPVVAVLCQRLSEHRVGSGRPEGLPPKGTTRERTSHAGRYRPGRDRP
ncbi:MAG: 16S rRNA (guanine(527)-N(7))-methyltransferase RsmG [Actinomycetia bacterium]|nr:16S rRNA (guanine(527)-N(7))-methyltransferase RsmG [Actinomycetes bacterium]